MINDQVNPGWWPDDEAHDDEPRHASWLISFADRTEQRIAAWPPLTRGEVLAAYRCADAVKAN